MSEPSEERSRKNHPASSGQPPRPAKAESRHPGGGTGAPEKTVYLLDPMLVKDLAAALHLKPFKVIADLMELKHFKSVHDNVDFATASLVARKHGYRAEKPPPGMLVL